MKRLGIKKKSKILDAGCGSGFLTLDLIERGYKVVGTDKSSEMVRQIRLNAKKRDLSVEAYHVMWADIAKHFGTNKFDLVYCRGNSLVYAASWEQNWIVPARSREEIKKAIDNFYRTLVPGGHLYLDVTNHEEKPHEEDLGIVETPQGPIQITWRIDHDKRHKIRTWTLRLLSKKTADARSYPSYSYLFSLEELAQFLRLAGFKKIDVGVKVNGEQNYDVFIARK